MPSSTFVRDISREARQTMNVGRQADASPNHIFIDCTPTSRRNCGTGVQRVVLNVVNHAVAAGNALDIECQGLNYTARHGFRPVASLTSRAHAEPAPVATGAVAVMSPRLTAGLKAPLRLLRHGARETLTALQLMNTVRNVKRSVKFQINTAQQLLAGDAESSVRPGRGDMLLLTDTIWDTPEVWDGVRRSASRGAMVGAIVYDLIPLRFPELYGAYVAKIFKDWITKVAYYSDFLMCISEAVWEDTKDYLKTNRVRNGRGEELRGGFFRLGVGLDAPADSIKVRPELARLYANDASQNPYLVVGSFDPRKDLGTVVRAFEWLWAGGSQAKLVTVGRPYTGSSPLERLVAEHPEQGRRLISLQDVEDAELDYCYRRSAALITASYAEGFNLPIVESLQRGRPVLAGDIPVHREVGGDFAHYFPCGQPGKLAELITRQQRGSLHRGLEQVQDFTWPDWTVSCQELFQKLSALYAAGANQKAA